MLTPENEKIVFTLNQLIMTCQDGKEGFHNAWEGVRNTELKQLFRRYEQECGRLLSELKPEVRHLGGEPDRHGTLSGVLHRGWMNLRQLLAGTNEAAVVDEAERSEDIAIASYQAALQEDLPPDIRVIVLRHHDLIKQAHARLSALKQAWHQAM